MSRAENIESDANACDLITVSAEARDETWAGSADIIVRVDGEAFFSGTTALKKAKEVANMVAQLTQAGVPEKDVFLLGVNAKVKSGLISKSSSAEYRLRIHCADLSMFADALGAITSQKNAHLVGVTWKFPTEDATRIALLEKSLGLVKEKGQKIAAALGVTVKGVHSFNESWLELPKQSGVMFERDDDLPASRARASRAFHDAADESVSSATMGFGIQNSKLIGVKVEVKFVVSQMAAT